MKKYFIILILFLSISAYGQFNSGSVYFTGLTGGNLSLEIQEFTTTLPYSINVEGGYFIQNRLSLGGNIHTHGAFDLGPNPGTHELYIGPALRYYLARAEGLQIYYYGNPFFSVSNGFNTIGIAAGAGINYFITEQIALEARGLYRYTRLSSGGFGYNAHRLGFEAGISIFFPSIDFFNGAFKQSGGEKNSSKKKEEDWSPN